MLEIMPSAETLSWRVSPVLPVAKLVGAVALATLAYAFGRHDPVQWVVATLVVLVLGGWALRDIVAPVRLTADPSGVTVPAGLLGRRHLPWSQIEQVQVDRRERRGLRSELLEIDAGESLHLFGIHELGTAPHEVAEALQALRRRP
jgi:hypothetical protein